LILIIWWRG